MNILDEVATLRSFPDHRLQKGQVGTVLEELDGEHVLVEFADMDGVAFTITPISARYLIALRRAPEILV